MGTILATILGVFVAQVAVGGALIAAFRLKRQPEAKPTRKRHEETFVTHEEMEEALDKHWKKLEWEWTEMYEKFEKLHLRLAKRDKRAEEQRQLPLSGEQRPAEGQPSILQLRKQGTL